MNVGIVKSKNEGKITLKNSVCPYMGGIVGYIERYNIIYECTNTGEIIGEGINGNIAGIVGDIATYEGQLINNENSGNLVLKKANESASSISISGISAISAYNTFYDSCKNTGNITIEDALNSNVNIAGIIGSDTSVYRECTRLYNEGKITVMKSLSGINASGISVGATIINKSVNKGDIEINCTGGIKVSGISNLINDNSNREIKENTNYGKISAISENGTVIVNGVVYVSGNSHLLENFGDIYAEGKSVKTNGISDGYGNIQNSFNKGNLKIKVTSDEEKAVVNGLFEAGSLKNCYNEGNIEIITDGKVECAGIASNGNNAIYSNCYNSGNIDIYSNGATTVNGLISNCGGLVNSYNKGNISVINNENTLIFGVGQNIGNIKNCYNEGNIEIITNGKVECAGIASRGNSEINSNCYNSGNINIFSNGTTTVSGLINHCVGVINSYNKGNISVVNNGNTLIGGIGYDMGNISNCYNAGDMYLITTKSSNNTVGGISSLSERPVNCYNVGDITVINGGESTWVDPIRSFYGAYDQSVRSCEFV